MEYVLYRHIHVDPQKKYKLLFEHLPLTTYVYLDENFNLYKSQIDYNEAFAIEVSESRMIKSEVAYYDKSEDKKIQEILPKTMYRAVEDQALAELYTLFFQLTHGQFNNLICHIQHVVKSQIWEPYRLNERETNEVIHLRSSR